MMDIDQLLHRIAVGWGEKGEDPRPPAGLEEMPRIARIRYSGRMVRGRPDIGIIGAVDYALLDYTSSASVLAAILSLLPTVTLSAHARRGLIIII